MNAPNNNHNPLSRLRDWWLTPPRSGAALLINPWEYKHLRLFGTTRIVGGLIGAAAGLICLSYGVYGWAAFFLAIGALNLAGGCWFVSISNSPSA